MRFMSRVYHLGADIFRANHSALLTGVHIGPGRANRPSQPSVNRRYANIGRPEPTFMEINYNLNLPVPVCRGRGGGVDRPVAYPAYI